MALFAKIAEAFGSRPVTNKKKSRDAQQRFSGVEIVPGPGSCCAAVNRVTGQRLLSVTAPVLPLADCDQAACACSYERYSDRRTEIRRDVDAGIGTASQMFHRNCQRSGARGRRATDRDKD